jgi:hypothetical protein
MLRWTNMCALRLSSVVLLAAALAACSSSERAPAGPADTVSGADPGTSDPAAADPSAADPAAADPAAAAPGSGTYTVPVEPELERFATFDVSDVRFRERGGELELSYDLPELLVGEPQQLSFRGASDPDEDGQFVLSGDSGVATCRQELELMRCDEVLERVELDTDKLERALDGLAPEEQQARRAVAERFSVDPIGFLRFEP